MPTLSFPLANRLSLVALAPIVFGAGICGMAASFLFLASSHPLDVTAGAAGFVAGSILVAAGLVSSAVQRSGMRVEGNAVRGRAELAPADTQLDVGRWTAHFEANQLNRVEPDWAAPVTLPAAAIAPLVHSLEQFQLGDGGGPAYLIAWDREKFLSRDIGTRTLVDLWFTEEREHARLLAKAVERFGGRCIRSHWSFTAFCLTRKWLGVRFELTVLLLTEIASTAYYRLLLRHGQDPALRAMCRLILRDETGHIEFHRDRLARKATGQIAQYGKLWAAIFRSLGLVAATVLWVNHSAGLRAIGGTRNDFYREVWRTLSGFIRKLRREI